MYYALNKTARMRKEPECVVLFSAEDGGRTRYLHPLLGVLLALCDGQRSGDDLLRVLIEAFGMPAERGAELLSRLTGDFSAYLTASPEPVSAHHRYDPVDFVYQAEGDPDLRRLSAPVSIDWLITERCPFDCIYCCIKTLPASHPADGELTHEQALRFLEDCVATGVQVFTFHGGEPFLRRDTPDMIEYLIGHGVFVIASTKLALPEETIARLRQAGLEQMQVSIDTPDSATADRIVGHHNYLRGAFHNIELLQRHGIAVSVNTVVTRLNVREVPELIAVLAAQGVRKISLATYIRSSWKHSDDLFPGRAELAAMAKNVEALRLQLPEVEVKMGPLRDPRDLSLAQDGFSACSGGRKGLVVGADGRVSICDRLLPFGDAVVGNVKNESLLEIWNGARLHALLEPGEEAFAGTECAGCGLKETCDWRVRCYYRSQMIRERLFAPDHLCPIVPAPSIRFF
jgi:radical SAM protein with 4Fe4S-binding SPASM domain